MRKKPGLRPYVQNLSRLLAMWLGLTTVFIVAKIFFMAVNHGVLDLSVSDALSVLWHGLAMDLSMSAYLTVLPALLLILDIWSADMLHRLIMKVLAVYSWIISLVIALGVVTDTAVYPYWHVKLDSTVWFYVSSSPAAALASATWWQMLLGVAGVILLTAVSALWLTVLQRATEPNKQLLRGRVTLVMLLATAALIIPIRGGLTVSTMNPSRAYFSTRQTLNHAAVNPIFSFMYSMTHQLNPGNRFKYFEPEKGASLFRELEKATEPIDTVAPVSLSVSRPDIYLIVLESFSSHLMPSLGGEDVAMRLDSIANTGVSFTRAYASSFRTDRALPAVFSGYPAQPTTSIMKFVDKTDRLPSMPQVLKDHGYRLSYYYGGDINFTNMNSYVKSMGFDHVVADTDFPVTDRMSKWGVNDHTLLQRVMEETRATDDAKPRFVAIQTSSSHEPYDVPYTSSHSNKAANAFAYTDHWLGVLIDTLSQRPSWNRTLVVMVPDHYGSYPTGITEPPERHRIPIVMCGGAIADSLPRQIDAVMAQTDLAATLLDMLQLPADELTFSRSVFDPLYRRYAFFSNPDYAGIVTDSTEAVVSVADGTTIQGDSLTADYVRTYLQTLYNDINQR